MELSLLLLLFALHSSLAVVAFISSKQERKKNYEKLLECEKQLNFQNYEVVFFVFRLL